MSLDVMLHGAPAKSPGTGIFVRESGSTRELTWEEWHEHHPGQEPVVFRPDGADDEESDPIFSLNITHNLRTMAIEAGIYEHLWRPEEIGIERASQLVGPLREGLELLRSDPARFEAFNSPNGWGMYEHFVPFVAEYLAACEAFPDALVSVSV